MDFYPDNYCPHIQAPAPDSLWSIQYITITFLWGGCSYQFLKKRIIVFSSGFHHQSSSMIRFHQYVCHRLEIRDCLLEQNALQLVFLIVLFFIKYFIVPRPIWWSHWLLRFWHSSVLLYGFLVQTGSLTCNCCLGRVILKVMSGSTPAFHKVNTT